MPLRPCYVVPMSTATRASQVIKAIGSDKLELVQGNGYWYFIYDDLAKNRYDTKSVYVMRLRDFTLEEWVAEGREFVAKMEQQK